MKRHSLSTSSFSVGKYGARAASCIGMILLVALIFRIANYFAGIDRMWSWPRVFWGKYYQNEWNIDSIFLGSSHVFCGISPEVMDRKLGGNHWNMATNGMRLNNAYSILQEVDSKHDLKNVYLELFWWCSSTASGETYSSESYYYNSMHTDYRTVNPYRLELQLTMSSPARYLETFFPGVRYKQFLLRPWVLKENLKYRWSDSYKNNTFREETERGITEYQDKGFWYSSIEMCDTYRVTDKYRPVSAEAALTASAEQYLRKIIEYCQGNGINITLFCSPMYDLVPLAAGDYDAYVNHVRAIANEYGIAYYDFNLIKPQYLDIQHLEYFKDSDHLNTKGAVYFSNLFADIIKNPSTSCAMFYSSYKEKLADSRPEVYGLYYDKLKDGKKRFYIAANKMDGTTYTAFIKSYKGDAYQAEIRDTDNSFVVNEDSDGEIELSWQMENMDESGKYVIKYYK